MALDRRLLLFEFNRAASLNDLPDNTTNQQCSIGNQEGSLLVAEPLIMQTRLHSNGFVVFVMHWR